MTKEVFSRVLDYKTGLTGASVLSALTIKYGAFQGFICQDYTVVQVITDAQGNDVTAQMGLRGVTLSPGIYISMAKGDSIYSIILSSGSIILYDLGADMSSVPGVSDLITAFSTRASVDGATLESTSCIDGPLMPYFKKASFYLTPSAYKGGKLYAQKPITGNGDLTWTRGGDAFRTNSSGLVQRMPWNLFQQSETFDNVVWSKSNLSVSANSTTAPNGTSTADTIIPNSTNSYHPILQTVTVVSGTQYTFSIYAKSAGYDFLLINTSLGSVSGNVGPLFNLSTGALIGSFGGNTYGATITSVGNGWYRIVFSYVTNSTSTSIDCNSFPTSSISTYSGNGTSGLYLWGAQLVEGTTAQTYLPTTDRLGFPRLDYTYGTCPAALLEPQRTNLALYSEQFDNAYWTKTNLNTSGTPQWIGLPNSPDGLNSSTKLIANTTLSAHGVTRTDVVSYLANTNYCFSLFLKKAELEYAQISFILRNGTTFQENGIININLNNNTFTLSSVSIFQSISGNLEVLQNGWVKASVIVRTPTSGSTRLDASIRLTDSSFNNTFSGNDVNGLFIFGAQVEVGSYPTTYIPTTSATATRVADSFSRSNIYTNGLISASGGTWFVELRGNLALIRDNTQRFGIANTTSYSNDGLTISNPSSSTASRLSIQKRIASALTNLHTTTTDTVKIAIKWNGTTADIFENGVKVISATSFTPTNMEFFGSTGACVPFFIQQMALFPTPLSDTDCTTITTL